MKKSIRRFLLTNLLLVSTLSLIAQNVTLNYENVSLKVVFASIKKQTGLNFSYSTQLVNPERTVSINVINKPVETVLKQLLNGTNLTFEKKEKNILLFEKPKPIEPKTAPNRSKKVSGFVTDPKGIPIIGANIRLQDKRIGTISDSNGKFELNIYEDGILEVSYIGYESKKVAINGQSNLAIVLTEDSKLMNEVVVIGYGSLARKDLTGAVSSISQTALKDVPVSSVGELLTGRLAGVQVTTADGSPDADVNIKIRGGGSITQDNSPLYIVDGFQVDKINDISPSSIESIDVLKDASSTAIYGSRGANGVIVVTTKSGLKGKTKTTINSYMGLRKNVRELHVMNPYDYVYHQYEMAAMDDRGGNSGSAVSQFTKNYGNFKDLDIYKSMPMNNWQRDFFGRTALLQNYNVNISGGTDLTTFSLDLTRADEQGVMRNSGLQRNNINFRLQTKLSKDLTFDFNGRTAFSTIDGFRLNEKEGSTTTNYYIPLLLRYAPVDRLNSISLDDLGGSEDPTSPEYISKLIPPLKLIDAQYQQQKQYSASYNGGLNWVIIPELIARSQASYSLNRDQTNAYFGPNSPWVKYEGGGQPIGRIKTYSSTAFQMTNTLTYKKNKFLLNKGNLTTLLGQELRSSQYVNNTNEARNFPYDMDAQDVFANFNQGIARPIISYISADNNLLSFFGRINYDISSKYLFSATYRADGSSKFAKGNQWGFFPSAAFAWRLSDEQFMKESKSWLNNLKLRFSYGTSGNDRISSGLWLMNYTTDNSISYWQSGVRTNQLIPTSSLSNPSLRWETTISRNLGVDFTLFSKFSGTIEYYWNTTKDLLINMDIPTSSGFTKQYQNVGQTSNRGLELMLNAHIIDKGAFTLSSTINFSFNKNNVDKLNIGNSNFTTYSSNVLGNTLDYIVKEGEPLGQMYGYVTDGMTSFDDYTFNNTTKQWEKKPGNEGWDIVRSKPQMGPGPGTLKYKDINGPDGVPDNKIDAYDKTVLGNANPLSRGGFSINAGYKTKFGKFDLSTFFNWSYGNNVYNANKLLLTALDINYTKYQNMSDLMSVRNGTFQTVDPVTGKFIYSGLDADPNRLKEINKDAKIWHANSIETKLHSFAIEDGSFLRLNNVTLGYTIPDNFARDLKISMLRLYVTGYNLFCWTKYTGYDPEVDSVRDSPMTPGIDWSAYPKSRTFVFGLNLSF